MRLMVGILLLEEWCWTSFCWLDKRWTKVKPSTRLPKNTRLSLPWLCYKSTWWAFTWMMPRLPPMQKHFVRRLSHRIGIVVLCNMGWAAKTHMFHQGLNLLILARDSKGLRRQQYLRKAKHCLVQFTVVCSRLSSAIQNKCNLLEAEFEHLQGNHYLAVELYKVSIWQCMQAGVCSWTSVGLWKDGQCTLWLAGDYNISSHVVSGTSSWIICTMGCVC